jgi:hypothetical protein
VTESEVCVTFHATRTHTVDELRPTLSVVEAYYDPSMRAEAMFAVVDNTETSELRPPQVRLRACVCMRSAISHR